MICIKNLNINMNDFDLKIDTLEIDDYEFFGILGESGCGKSSLLKIIAGLKTLNSGQILVDNKDISNIKTENRNIGMVFQNPLLFPNMNVLENVAFALKMQKLSKKVRYDRALEVLKDMNIDHLKYKKINQLSGGEKQRVSIARSIVLVPKILLMDEPFSALDTNTKIQMQNFIKDIHRKYEITIIFVTHDINEAFVLFDKVAIMKDGKVEQTGTLEEIYNAPRNIYIAKLLGFKNILSKGAKNKILQFQSRNGENVILKSEKLSISKGSHSDYQLYGKIVDILFKEGFYEFKISIEDEYIYIKILNNIEFKKYDNVFIGFDEQDIIIM